jgi:hypothetical protein
MNRIMLIINWSLILGWALHVLVPSENSGHNTEMNWLLIISVKAMAQHDRHDQLSTTYACCLVPSMVTPMETKLVQNAYLAVMSTALVCFHLRYCRQTKQHDGCWILVAITRPLFPRSPYIYYPGENASLLNLTGQVWLGNKHLGCDWFSSLGSQASTWLSQTRSFACKVICLVQRFWPASLGKETDWFAAFLDASCTR